MTIIDDFTKEALFTQYDVDKLTSLPYYRNSLGGVHY